MVVLPALSSPAIPTYSSSSRWWQYPRPDARWTRLSVLTQLEVSLLGTKEWQVRQSPGLRRSETDDRSWEWCLGTVGRGHLSSINLAALDSLSQGVLEAEAGGPRVTLSHGGTPWEYPADTTQLCTFQGQNLIPPRGFVCLFVCLLLVFFSETGFPNVALTVLNSHVDQASL